MTDMLKTVYPPYTTFCASFLEANWQLTLHSVFRSDQISYSSKLFLHVLITCKYEKDWIINSREEVEKLSFQL